MKQELILEALAKLDPDNNDHWTQDGSPRLGAVGEGVTRQQIQEIAPLFTRKSAVLPEPEAEPTDEEIFAEVKRAEQEFQARKEAANKEVSDALKAKADAEDRLHKARTDLSRVAAEEKSRDTRTETQANMDYLKSEFEQRMKRALQQEQIFDHLRKLNLPTSGVDMSNVSLADRAIAARVIKERRERLRNGGK